MKKIFCLFFAFVIVLLCGVNVFAASSKRIIGASIPNATSYELYLLKNGVYTLMQTSSSINFDLLSLDLDPGDHQFVVRATAPGFAPSSYSNVVTYSVSDFSYWNTSNVTSMRYMFASLANTHGYYAEQTVFLDFNIIELTCEKEGVATVIPVSSAKQDIAGDVTPPTDGVDANTDVNWDSLLAKLFSVIFVLIILAGFAYFLPIMQGVMNWLFPKKRE